MKAFLLAGAVALAGVLALEADAQACGGCFAPTENPTVVSDHRMILSISQDQSTLYDQIRYSGSPASFAWVLPIAGTVQVGLSADIVFSGLDQMTQTRLVAPPLNCPPPPDCFGSSSSGGFGSAGNAAPPQDGVDVLKHEVVGPYETVQLKATDPSALNDWLTQNGFAIPTDVQPVIGAYVNEKFNFLALKLVPGKGVQDMRPVRVTTTGASAVLPLRMVAAGTGPTVGISLWIVGEGRYEPQNFPSFVIDASELSWDWSQSKSNYTELRAQKTAAGGGRAWEIESSTDLYRQSLESLVQQGSYDGQGPYPTTDEERAAQDYLPVKDDQGNVVKTAAQVRDEDLATLFHGISSTSSRVTRMRADLAHASLDQDLAMSAAANQAVLSNVRQITKETNQPLCPVYEGCSQTGNAPRDEAIAKSKDNWGSSNGTFSCSTSQTGALSWMTAGLGFAGLAVVQAVRRRRR